MVKVILPKTKTKKRYMYVGPDLNHQLKNGAVFIGTNRPDYLQEAFERFPLLQHLMVDVNQLPAVEQDLRNQKGIVYVAYQEVLKGVNANV